MSDIIVDSSRAYGEDHAPKSKILEPVNLRVKDLTDDKMYGIQSSAEADTELADFRKDIESTVRLAQYSWDCACIFDAGSDDFISVPRTMIAEALPVKVLKKKSKAKPKESNKKPKSASMFNFFDPNEDNDFDRESQSEEQDSPVSSRHSKRKVIKQSKLNKRDASSDEEDESDVSSKAKFKRSKHNLSKKKQDSDESEVEDSAQDESDVQQDVEDSENEHEDKKTGPPDIAAMEGALGSTVELPERELFTRTTAQLISALNYAGLKTCVYSPSPKMMVCLIGATEERLEEEAARIGYEIQLDNTACMNVGIDKGMPLAWYTKLNGNVEDWGTIFGPFLRYSSANAHRHMLYRRYTEAPYHVNSFFQSADRVKLITSIIESEIHKGDVFIFDL